MDFARPCLAARLTAMMLAIALGGILPPNETRAGESGGAVEREPPGRDVDSLLAIARRMSPETAAAALSAEAAAARIEAAGALPDPMFETEFRDIVGSRRSDGVVPERVDRIDYRIAQRFPMWGKRTLRSDIARAEAGAARDRARAVAVGLDARIRTAFAEHYRADRAIAITRALRASLDDLARAAARRYVHGAGAQPETLRVQAEGSRLDADLKRREAAKRRTAARLNALLDRPADAPLADPEVLPPLPPPGSLVVADLIERALRANPEIAADRSEVQAAEGGRVLAERNWYPDPGVRLSLYQVNPDNGSARFEGYEAMLFFEIPLQWQVRRDQEREAAAGFHAAKMRLRAAEASLRGDLEEAVAMATAAREAVDILERTVIPQAEAAYRSALSGYRLGGTEFTAVLEAEQSVRRMRLEVLEEVVAGQAATAEIERLIGEPL